jgi:hypothetical protein
MKIKLEKIVLRFLGQVKNIEDSSHIWNKYI